MYYDNPETYELLGNKEALRIRKGTMLHESKEKGEKMKYYIDIGSNKIKIYETEKENIKLLEERKISFKEYFSEEIGISTKNYRELMIYIKELVQKYQINSKNCNIYVTGIWRKISQEQYEMLRADFSEIGLIFKIISQEEEILYFEKAMEEIYINKNVLMVNMGVKTTELIAYDKGNIITKKILNIGVAEILNNFPEINDYKNKVKIEDVVNYSMNIIGDENIDFNCEYGIFISAELRVKKLVRYNLIPNKIFNDGIHEYIISYDDFNKKNKQLLEKITVEDLYLLMPSNKKWVDGVKAGAILAQAIFKKANIKYIIPSDLNIINGII